MRRGRGARDSGTYSAVSTSAGHPDRDVDEEHPPPAGDADQRAADDRAEREAEARDAAPHADRLRALARILEHVADDRHRHRVQHRRSDRLHDPERDQRPERRRQRAQQGAEREQRSSRSGTRAAGRSGRRSSPPASAGSRSPACTRRRSTEGPTRTRAASGGSKAARRSRSSRRARPSAARCSRSPGSRRRRPRVGCSCPEVPIDSSLVRGRRQSRPGPRYAA